MPEDSKKPVVRVRPSSYYPTREDLEEDVSVDASPEQVRAACYFRI